MNSTTFADVDLLAQQGVGDYDAGQIAGVIFLIVLGGSNSVEVREEVGVLDSAAKLPPITSRKTIRYTSSHGPREF